MNNFVSKLVVLLTALTSIGFAMEELPTNVVVASKNHLASSPARVSVLENYFQELSKALPEGKKSYRAFTIWAAGEKNHIPKQSFIAGDAKRAQQWSQLTHDFLTASKQFNGDFVFELIVDKKTLNDNQAQIDRLSSDFPTSFKVTLLESIFDDLLSKLPNKLKPILLHLKTGNPAVGSDFLRKLKLYDLRYHLLTLRSQLPH